jgi:beta-lactamase regulating signal transducer with metallopeptidase domain
MTVDLQTLNHPFVETLGWSLIHFLWQGILVAMLAASLLAALKNASASARYVVACFAFVLMAIAPVATVLTMTSHKATNQGAATITNHEPPDAAVSAANGSLVQAPPLTATVALSPDEMPDAAAGVPLTATSESASNSETLTAWLATLVVGWLLGVTALSLRLIFTLLQVSRLRNRNTSSASASLVDRVEKLTHRLRVSRPVRLAQSALVEVPTVIGAVKPLILLPASAMTGLSAEQLDAILAHEIAHIRRHDYFVNLIQTVIETLLFYHPAVWWLSSRIRQERENCCDDIASAACENPLRYAQALVRMEELRTPGGSLVLTATGGNLKLRIRRLLGQHTRQESRPGWWVGGLVSLLIVGGLILCVASLPAQTVADEPDQQPTTDNSAVDESPKDQTADNPTADEQTQAAGDETEVTTAQIADSVQDSMRTYETVEYSAEFLPDGDPGKTPSTASSDNVKAAASFRYRASGVRFFAENTGNPSKVGDPRNWIEGFDGTVHYHTESTLLILGEESLSGQTLSATNLLFSLNGRAHETAGLLRDKDAKLVDGIEVEGTQCLVVELQRTRGERTWKYRFAIAPERSWLPLVSERFENGTLTIRHTLTRLADSKGVWYPKRITTVRTNESQPESTRRIRVARFSAHPDFNDDSFAPPFQFGTNVLDRRVGYGWNEDPWWSDLKPWLKKEFGWPRADLFEMHSISNYGPCPLEGKPAPPVEPAEWLTPEPGGWERPERKLTLLYFYGGRLITPTPKWAAAISELHRRYQKYGFEVIGLAAATSTPELPRQAAKELRIKFPVGIDQTSATAYGKTFLSFGLTSYHGLMFVDHEGLVRPCPMGDASQVKVNGKDFKISHMEAKVIAMLKQAGVENVEPQVLPGDIFDIKAYNRVLKEWKRLMSAAPKGASVHGNVTFNGAPVAGATIRLEPMMTMMSSNTGHGFMSFSDLAGTLTVSAGPDGTYAINDLPKGEYAFTCESAGFGKAARTIMIGSDLPKVNVDVALRQK